MSDSTDYVKYVTEKFVGYLDKSPEAVESRQEKKQHREHWATRWFGVVPLGVSMWWGNFDSRRNKNRAEARSVNPPN
ncbi:YqzE family protein [Cohnella sp. GCM10027633]|uniref:YqzE family protein n=1 Tax=unclassified Cohnella TaxID=2636738 RepID=UPI00363F9C66